MQDDATLVAQAKQGERAAFEQIYNFNTAGTGTFNYAVDLLRVKKFGQRDSAYGSIT